MYQFTLVVLGEFTGDVPSDQEIVCTPDVVRVFDSLRVGDYNCHHCYWIECIVNGISCGKIHKVDISKSIRSVLKYSIQRIVGLKNPIILIPPP